ncbi:MAG: metallophosphoesterase [Candidatus Ratteibacteria bacterium]|nr:metallophosphoesterase [Candidatus Ratteibacteria bacterium]
MRDKMEGIKLLTIGDIHYSTKPAEIPHRKAEYGLELLKRALKRSTWEEKPDVIVIPGDIINEISEGMEVLLLEVKKSLDATKIPVVCIPGNHDGNYEKFFNVMGETTGAHFIKNFIIYSFADAYGEGDTCTRKEDDIERFISTVKRHPDKKVIVLQHSPVYPSIESSYPYNLTNSEKVDKIYRENRVLLSISGHYHPGQKLTYKDGVYYLTVPVLCEDPFRYLMIEIKGAKITVIEQQLKNPLPLCDNHCHTQFAYCAEDITIEKVLKRAKLLGMGYVCFTEHADQLYLTPEEYSKALSFYQPDILLKNKKERKDRMNLFKEAVNRYKCASVRMGLEVVPDRYGGISLLPEDREGVDILVGAIHFFPPEILSASTSKREKWFMDMVETLMKNNVDVLAHPFRVFQRSGLKTPETLFQPVVDILKDYNVSAELNFHTNSPEYKFFEVCLLEGIKISLGTDTHNLCEAGEFYPHIKFLTELGVSQDMLDRVLYKLL